MYGQGPRFDLINFQVFPKPGGSAPGKGSGCEVCFVLFSASKIQFSYEIFIEFPFFLCFPFSRTQWIVIMFHIGWRVPILLLLLLLERKSLSTLAKHILQDSTNFLEENHFCFEHSPSIRVNIVAHVASRKKLSRNAIKSNHANIMPIWQNFESKNPADSFSANTLPKNLKQKANKLEAWKAFFKLYTVFARLAHLRLRPLDTLENVFVCWLFGWKQWMSTQNWQAGEVVKITLLSARTYSIVPIRAERQKERCAFSFHHGSNHSRDTAASCQHPFLLLMFCFNLFNVHFPLEWDINIRMCVCSQTPAKQAKPSQWRRRQQPAKKCHPDVHVPHSILLMMV